jgi:hypothetical protein
VGYERMNELTKMTSINDLQHRKIIIQQQQLPTLISEDINSTDFSIEDLTNSIQKSGLEIEYAKRYAEILVTQLGIAKKTLLAQVTTEDLHECGIIRPVHVKIILTALSSSSSSIINNRSTYNKNSNGNQAYFTRMNRKQSYLIFFILFILLVSGLNFTLAGLTVHPSSFNILSPSSLLSTSSSLPLSTSFFQPINEVPNNEEEVIIPDIAPEITVPSQNNDEDENTVSNEHPNQQLPPPNLHDSFNNYNLDILNNTSQSVTLQNKDNSTTTIHGRINFSSQPFASTIRAYGSSVRSNQLIPNVDWFIPNIPTKPYTSQERLRIHGKHVSAALKLMPFRRLCPPGQGGWLWVEDDVSLCEGTRQHIESIDCLLRKLPVTDPLVYVRTSFGFNGLVIRCSRHGEFMAAVDSTAHDSKVGLDYSVSFYFRNQGKNRAERALWPIRVATYMYQLFSHAGMKSEIWPGYNNENDISERETNLPKCLSLNLNTHNPIEVYDAYCIDVSSPFSPCVEKRTLWKQLAPSCSFPTLPDSRLKLNMSYSILAINGNMTCTEVCEKVGKICSKRAIYEINQALVSGTTVQFDDYHESCKRIRTMTKGSVYKKHCQRPFRAQDGYCFARIPVMDELNPCDKFRSIPEKTCPGNFICGCL